MKLKSLILFLLLIGYYTAGVAQEKTVLFIHNIDNLQHNKQEIENGNKKLIQAKNTLIKKAQGIIEKNDTYAVTYKKQLPPSGDIHDFYSLSRYWWPNPDTKDGLPFIWKDGKPYPGRQKISDASMLSKLGNNVYTLGLAYYYTGDEIYAERIKKLVSIFFINKKTKMNPNFEFSQIKLGHPNSGGATISANHFLDVIEGIQLIKNSNAWSKKEQQHMESWFKKYLDWMLNSKKGAKERKASNNIGTYYTVQAATYALFSKQEKLAKKIIEEDAPKRIADQIDETGAMSKELKRATPWDYVKYNLDAFKYLVNVAQKTNVDLWNYEAPNKGSIKKAFEWLVPYAKDEKKWNYGKKVYKKSAFRIVLKRSGFFTTKDFPFMDKVDVTYTYSLENPN